MGRLAGGVVALALLTGCTSVGMRDPRALASVDFGPPTVLRLCALAEAGIEWEEVAILVADAWRDVGSDVGVAVEVREVRPWVRRGFTVFGLGDQLLAEVLPEQCDRVFAFVGRTFGDALFGVSGLPEVLGWVNDETRTHGYVVAHRASLNQVMISPAGWLRHELFHALGCGHALTLAGCYRRIADLKRARVGEFFPAWDAERGAVLPTRRAVAERLRDIAPKN